MTPLFAFLTDDDAGLPGFGPLSPAVRERLIVLGAVLFVVGILVFWTLVVRKQKRRSADRPRHHRQRHRQSAIKTAAAGVGEIKKMIHEGERRRRREHRPRNPTLAETGGLPPRADDKASPSAPQTQP